MSCKSSILLFKNIFEICWFSLKGNKGGALFCNDEFTGILSNGISCGAVNQPGVYTQVRFFNDWIDQQFLRTDIPAAGSIPFGL